MKKVALIVAAALLIVVAAVPIYSQYKPSTTKDLVIRLYTDLTSYQHGQSVNLTVNIKNPTKQTISETLSYGPVCDFWITTTGGKEVWRYSTQNPVYSRQKISIEAGKSKDYRATWNQKDSRGNLVQPGRYYAYAKFAGQSATRAQMRTDITIQERAGYGAVTLLVPVNAGVVNRHTDIGRRIRIEGTLRNSPRGLYVDSPTVKIGG